MTPEELNATTLPTESDVIAELEEYLIKMCRPVSPSEAYRTRPSTKIVDGRLSNASSPRYSPPRVPGGMKGKPSIGLLAQHLAPEASKPLRDRRSLP